MLFAALVCVCGTLPVEFYTLEVKAAATAAARHGLRCDVEVREVQKCNAAVFARYESCDDKANVERRPKQPEEGSSEGLQQVHVAMAAMDALVQSIFVARYHSLQWSRVERSREGKGGWG